MPHCLGIPNLRFFAVKAQKNLAFNIPKFRKPVMHITSHCSTQVVKNKVINFPSQLSRPKNTNYLEICFPSQNSNSFAFTWSTESQLQKIDTKEKSLSFGLFGIVWGFFCQPRQSFLEHANMVSGLVQPAPAG